MMKEFEKLGLFYLGRPVDRETGEPVDEPLLYDARDLTTHAVCLGMTGSGKTGLCIALLEEAAIDGVPAIVIDPKGDLTNLLLTFPDLDAKSFAPWVQAEEARRKDLSLDEFAAKEAEKWRNGLAKWGQDGARIAKLREAADFRVFTPGSTAGEPVSILATFAPPPAALLDDPELLADRVASTATSLLGLAGITGDPLKSREHILISLLFDKRWRDRGAYDLAGLIADVQKPPLDRIGVMPLESFYPAKERFELAMTLNSILAAPGFATWFAGTPLDPARLLRAENGRPRIAILSIAHLSDAERMFFVTLLFNQMLGWMRSQPGTGSLRAILYMDEIFGYLPPTENPPSKKPLLTILKQARAFGVGTVLATQNPVDLDYKALSNIGTWFLGRLQTERDQARVLDGLAGIGGREFDRSAVGRQLAGLASRRFLLHNVHDEAPTLFESRWAMSYLAGPLTRDQIRRLKDGLPAMSEERTAAAPRHAPGAAAKPAGSPHPRVVGEAAPIVPEGIAVRYLQGADRATGSTPERYIAGLLGEARIHYADGKAGWTTSEDLFVALPLVDGEPVDWRGAEEVAAEVVARDPEVPGLAYGPMPAEASRPRSYATWRKSLGATLARERRLTLLRSSELRESSRPQESEAEFRSRLALMLRERRDGEIEKVRSKFEPKAATLRDRLRRAEAKVAEQQSQATTKKLETVASAAGALFGAFFGRRKLSSTTLTRATSTARSMSRSRKEARDVELAEESAGAIREQIAGVEEELTDALAAIDAQSDPASLPLETVEIKPKRADVEVIEVALAWRPD